ncbi:MAG: hypothetical protein ACKOWF_05175, partial [Chloroflexota bacterium]
MKGRPQFSPPQRVEMCPPHPLTFGQRARTLASDVFGSLYEANPPALASQVAYSMVFALPSILLMVVLAAVQIDLRTGSKMAESIRGAIRAQAPGDLQDVLIGLLDTSVDKASHT